MPVVTTRLIIVCTAESKDLVNQTISAIDPKSTGNVLIIPLRTPSSTDVVAYWANWGMDDANRSDFMAAVRDAGWSPRPSNAERTVYEPGARVPAFGSQRVWLFNGLTWTNETVLAELGLRVFSADDYEEE